VTPPLWVSGHTVAPRILGAYAEGTSETRSAHATRCSASRRIGAGRTQRIPMAEDAGSDGILLSGAAISPGRQGKHRRSSSALQVCVLFVF
jgi:hypothetical protein